MIDASFCAAALLHIGEKDDFSHCPAAEDASQAWRYDNAANSLQYPMIHLTGDFPLIDYEPFSRPVADPSSDRP